jgi:D-alanine-D-alanine ligase
MNKLKILVVKGGPSTEHQVSLASGQMVFENLDRDLYDANQVVIEKNGIWLFEDGSELHLAESINKIKADKFDLVFNALHGKFGEDGTIQAILDQADILYTGSGSEASALAMSKDASNKIFEKNGLLVPKFETYSEKIDKIDLPYPIVVKPTSGGSSVGVSIVDNQDELRGAVDLALESDKSFIAQEFISGKEFSCPVLEDETGELIALPPIEIIPKISEFFDYKAKYEDGGSEEVVNPEIGEENLEKIKDLALKAHEYLGCSGYSRTDFIEREGIFYVIETNTLPGMTKHSLMPKSAGVARIGFSKLLDLIIKSALRKKKL